MGKCLLRFFWLLLICTIWCQNLLTSILALGWVYRWVQYRVSKRLFRESALAEKRSWQEFASNHESLTQVRDIPHLFRKQPGIPSPSNSIFKSIHEWLHACGLNFRVGLGAVLTTWTLTLFPCAMWAIAWYTGWHISFTKMYEESATGASLGFSGLLLLTGIMLYLPVAQARQAFTGDWRSFFDWRFVRTLLWRRPLQLFLLAIAYAMANIMLTFFKALLTFLPTMNPALANLSAIEALEFLNQYYFYTVGVAFLLLLALRNCGGNIYSSALIEIWRQSALKAEAFHREEVRLFELLEISYGDLYQKPGLGRKIWKIPVNLSYRGIMLALTVLVWSFFNFIPFVSEFFNYYPIRGFINQPLVQLPCFRYVPTHLEAKAAAEKHLEENEQ